MERRVLALLTGAWLALVGPWWPGVPTACAQAEQDVEIELEQFGVGSAYRPGDVTGIRIRLTSNLDEPMQAWVQWEMPNADGDIGEYGRSISLTPRLSTSVWLYAPLLPEPGEVWSIRVFEERDGQRQAELGGARIGPADASRGPAQQVPIVAGMIGVIGRSRMNLDDLQFVDLMMERPHSAHEQTRIISGLSPGDCPDRWFGWRPFEAVVWGEAGRESPQDLGTDRADALREFVFRGGHLVIVLPRAGNPWGLGVTDNVRTELSDLLPSERPRTDVIPLHQLLPVISKCDEALVRPMPEFEVQVFKQLGGGDDFIRGTAYEPILALEDGRVIAVQRLYGHGRITIVGLDVASGQLNAIRLANGSSGLPQGDIFWNRILGRRADLPTSTELNAIKSAGLLSSNTIARSNGLGRGGLISQQIAMSRQAALGLMLALVLFAAYWIVAGPGGFALLRQYKLVQHSWLAFAAAAGAFTAVAWGAVALLPEDLAPVRHITVVDYVARPSWDATRREEPQLARAVCYFSVYLEDYRLTRLHLDPAGRGRDLMHSWTAPGVDSRRFPNVDQFRVDVGYSPADFSLPARSTATQLVAHWAGGIDSGWGGMIREDPEQPIRVTRTPGGQEQLEGSIIHDLPGELTDVSVIWITSDRVPRRVYARRDQAWQAWIARYGGELPNTGYIVRPGAFVPGRSYDLASLIQPVTPLRLADSIKKRYVDSYTSQDRLPGSATIPTRDMYNYLEMLSLYHQLTPPPYLLQQRDDTGQPIIAFTRELGRSLDLSAWFTRPCLIIIGYLEDSATPVPIRIDDDDEAPDSVGRTMVRWICPLPLDEQRAFPRAGSDAR